MRTEELIRSLASDTRPVSRHAHQQRVLIGLVGGGLAALAVMVPWMGFRQDLPDAMISAAFLMKWAYTISLGIVALIATVQVSRPESAPMRLIWLIAVPFVMLAMVSALELATTPLEGWMPMWLGHSWQQCSARVAMLAVPIFAGLLWSFRSLAPTRLRAAGAVAGLVSGASAATIYGLHCPEVSATFVLTWYTLGIVAAAGIGALDGPRLLRW